MRVVVADAHAGARHALASVLAAEPALELVAACADLAAASAALRRHRADGLVVATGLLRAGRGALGPVRAETVIVVVGMDDSPAAARLVLAQGADAYVVKDRAHTGLIDALLQAA